MTCSQFNADYRKKWEHPAGIKHQEDKADCSFDSSSSSFSYDPRLLDPARLFLQPNVNLKSPSPPAARPPPPSFHPIPDADAMAIPIDLNRGISDYNLMVGGLCWISNYVADCVPFPTPGSSSSSSSTTSVIIKKHLNLPSRDQHTVIFEPPQELRQGAAPPVLQQEGQDHHHAKAQADQELTLLPPAREEDHEANDLIPVDTAPLATMRAPRRKFDGFSQHHQSTSNKHQQSEKKIKIAPAPEAFSQNREPKRISPPRCPTKSKPSTSMLLEEEQVEISKKDNAQEVFPDERLSKTTCNVSLSGNHFQPRSMRRFRKSRHENWTAMVKDATAFRVRSGHCVIPHNYPPNQKLALWAKRQRYQYRLLISGNTKQQCSMTKERVEALDSIDFCWDIWKAVWERRYEELKQFKEINGHANVPNPYPENYKLPVWVKRQRREYARFVTGGISSSHISPDRIEMLNNLDFAWSS
jgi:hypothetical protein